MASPSEDLASGVGDVGWVLGVGGGALAACALFWATCQAVFAAWRDGALLASLAGLLSVLGTALVLTSPVWLVVLVAAVAGGALGSGPRRGRRRGRRARLPEPEREAPAEAPPVRMLAPRPGEFTPDCPVCGVALAGPVRFCPACEAPHHPDCWDYHGSCATYGCGGA